MAAISYDSEGILRYFSNKRKIDFPLLADPDAKVIGAYEVLNPEATGQYRNMARPGYFSIDTQGVIREKFFEAKYRDRLSGNNVIAKLFPELGEEVTTSVAAPHLQLAVAQSDRVAFPGNHITLTTEIQLPPGTHVYAPSVKGYKPIKLLIDPIREVQLKTAVHPESKVLYLPAINERVPVYEGTFRIRQDVQVATAAEFQQRPGCRWQNHNDYGQAGIPGLRQQDLFPAGLGCDSLAIAGSAIGSATRAPKTFNINRW